MKQHASPSPAAVEPRPTPVADWREDLSLMGLHLSGDGSQVTVTPQVMTALFGRPALYDFSVSMSSTTLLRLRHLLTVATGRLHLPVDGQILAYDHTIRPTTRLIATAQDAPFQRMLLEVTTWVRDGSEAWLDTHLLEDLTSADIAHFHAVRAIWDAGIKPLHCAARYVAAGLSAAEVRHLEATMDPAARDAMIGVLTSLRGA